MKQILIALFIGVLVLHACAQREITTPVTANQEPTATPFPISTSTNTFIPTATPTASITSLPTIPTFTPTFDASVQPNPFPTASPNPTAEAIVKKWNFGTALLSPDGNWAAASAQGIMHIIQTQGNNELSVKCEIFAVCEFVIPVQWSPDSRMLYFASLLTGESNVPFRQYTGIARIDVNTGKFDKLVEDSSDEREYSMSLSPDGNYLAFTETEEQRPSLGIVETETLEKTVVQQIDNGADAGNILWTRESEKNCFCCSHQLRKLYLFF